VNTRGRPTTSWSPFPPLTTRLQLDEKWGFVGEKEKTCDPDADETDFERGDQRDFVALDPDSRLVLSVLVGWSVAFWTGSLNARARDVRLVFRWVLLIWLYVTPVLYPLSSLPEPIGALAEFNPVVAPVEMVKEGFLNIGSLELDRLPVTLGFIVLVGGAGAWFCTRKAPGFIRSRMGLDDDEEDF